MQTKLELGDLELDIFRVSNQDRSFLIKMIGNLNSDFFESTSLSKVFTIYKKFFNAYNKAPTEKILKENLPKLGETDEKTEFICSKIFDISVPVQTVEKEYILDQVIKLSKKKRILDAIYKSTDIISDKKELDDKDLEEIVNEFRDAAKFSIDTDLGTDLYDVDGRYNSLMTELQDKIPTGYAQLDSVLGGGWSKKEIVCILGAPGFGKSIFLCNFGFHCLRNGKNVVHYSMEMSEARVGQRYDSIVSNIFTKQLTDSRDEIKESYDTLRKITKTRLRIKEFPTGMASVLDLEAHMEELKLHEDFVPDVVIVDYGDIMRSTRKTNNNYEEQGWIYRELRGLAVKRNISVITASQATRDSLKGDGGSAENIGMDKMADSMEKNRILDALFSIVQTKREKEDGVVNLWTAKNRNGEAAKTLQFKINYKNFKITESLLGSVKAEETNDE